MQKAHSGLQMLIDKYSNAILTDIVGWDVASWSKAIRYWDRFVPKDRTCDVLEIGANKGGVSLYFAMLGHNVLCTDLGDAASSARQTHERYDYPGTITYDTADATALEYEDNRFDIVCFKSLLGGIGRDDRMDRQLKAVSEMHRVLKPQGTLLFAENLTGSALHRVARRMFVRWAEHWRYLDPAEMDELFACFRELHSEFYGFLGAFGPHESIRELLSIPDTLVSKIVPMRCRYIAAGAGVK